jgi:hypothetical protein
VTKNIETLRAYLLKATYMRGPQPCHLQSMGPYLNHTVLPYLDAFLERVFDSFHLVRYYVPCSLRRDRTSKRRLSKFIVSCGNTKALHDFISGEKGSCKRVESHVSPHLRVTNATKEIRRKYSKLLKERDRLTKFSNRVDLSHGLLAG